MAQFAFFESGFTRVVSTVLEWLPPGITVVGSGARVASRQRQPLPVQGTERTPRALSGESRPSSPREDDEPLWPTATEFKEVLEVRQAACLQLIHERTERIDIVHGAKRDEITLDAKLGIGEPKASIERRTAQSCSFIRLTSKEQRGNSVSDG